MSRIIQSTKLQGEPRWQNALVTVATVVIGSALWLFTASAGAAGPTAELDPHFGVDGLVEAQCGSGQSTFGLTSAMQGDNILVGGYYLGEFSSSNLCVMRFHGDGRLDTSFGDQGQATFALEGFGLRAASIGVQPDGRIIQTGWAYDADNDFEIFAVRYLTDGEIDTTFGENGVAFVDFPDRADSNPGTLAFDHQGRLLVAGSTGSGCGLMLFEDPDCTFGIARLTADGMMDRTFGLDGKRVVSFGNWRSEPRSLIVRRDGRILVVGVGYVAEDKFEGIALSLTEDGDIDPRFGRDGWVRYRVGQLTTFSAVAEARDRKLVIAGAAGRSDNARLAVFRLRPNGQLDRSFNGRGYVSRKVDPDGSSGSRAVYVTPRGEIFVVGFSATDQDQTNTQFLLALVRPNGRFVRSFGTDGIVTTDFHGGVDLPWGMIMTGPRSLVISGYSETGYDEHEYSMALAGYRVRIIGNTITLTAPAAMVDLDNKVKATNTSTNYDDTIDSTFANLAGSVVDGAEGIDTLSVTEVSDTQATANLDGVTNVESINLSLSGATSITSLDSLIPAGGNLVINHAAGGSPLTFDGSAETDGAFTFNTAIDDQPDVLMGGAGDDTFNYADSTASLHLVGHDGDDVFHLGQIRDKTIEAGAGYDVLNLYENLTVLPFFNATGIEKINVFSDYQIRLNDAMLPADEPLVIDASLADGYILLSFHDVTEGRVTFIGSNHDDQLWLKGTDDPNTIDQLILGTGSDRVEVVSRDTSRIGSNTIANSAGIDEVSNFNVAGKDQIILTKQPNELYEISVETADQADFVSGAAS